MKKELLKGLTKEQIEKVNSCSNIEELLALAKNEGIELSDEQLEAVTGGICTSTPEFVCPKCGSKNIKTRYNENSITSWWGNDCGDCGFHWNVDD